MPAPSPGCSAGAGPVRANRPLGAEQLAEGAFEKVVAQDPVPLEGLAATDDVFTFTVNEAIALANLDGDVNAVTSVNEASRRIFQAPEKVVVAC